MVNQNNMERLRQAVDVRRDARYRFAQDILDCWHRKNREANISE
jgi:hypothetical protein